jgi:hypothetical protein
METVTPAEVVVTPGEMTTTGPSFIVKVKSTDETKNFWFIKRAHEDWLTAVLKAMDNPSGRTMRVKLGPDVFFGGYHPLLSIESSPTPKG